MLKEEIKEFFREEIEEMGWDNPTNMELLECFVESIEQILE